MSSSSSRRTCATSERWPRTACARAWAGARSTLWSATTSTLPAQIRTCFAWHDGAHEDGADGTDTWLPHGKIPISLADSLAIAHDNLAGYGPNGTEDRDYDVWAPTWLPLLIVGGGGLSIVADLANGVDQLTPVHRVNFHPDVPWANVQDRR